MWMRIIPHLVLEIKWNQRIPDFTQWLGRWPNTSSQTSCQPAIRTGEVIAHSRNSRTRASSLGTSLVQHSHTIKTFQPMRLIKRTFLRNLSTFPARFCAQNFLFVFGVTRPYLQRCMCQKQPCTNITFLWRVRTISGQPGSFRWWRRNLYPRRCTSLRTIISGFVSLPRIRDMQYLRCLVVKTSAIRLL